MLDITKELDYVDAIMVIDRYGKIVYSVRYNPRFDSEVCEDALESILNKHILEVYPTINPNESSIVRSLETGKSIYLKAQTFTDFTGRVITTKNFTIPIIRNGKTLGIVELSKDITKLNESVGSWKFSIDSNKKSPRKLYCFEDIITENNEMKEIVKRAKNISRADTSVLIYGETGTGKELFIQSIHNESGRSNKPFIVQNCAALPENLFESILFGSVKGAFTGAIDRSGLLEEANGGTLFLDELNSMPTNLQAKLLRVIQDGVVRRIGDNKEKRVDVRVLAAMNIEPMEAMKRGLLREDLFFRLGVTTFRLLPLRERREDIPYYVKYFIDAFNDKYKKRIEDVSEDVMNLFKDYNWPGNVREIQHILESAMNFCEGEIISMADLPVYLEQSEKQTGEKLEESKLLISNQAYSLDEMVETLEKDIIKKALITSKGNISMASRMLKITRQKLHYKINKYGLEY